jgi:5-methylcytosine-specific restriction endonuclease McrA
MAGRLWKKIGHEAANTHLAAMEEASRKRRREYVAAARAAGRHTLREWEAMQAFIYGCVACGITLDEYAPYRMTKDHIVPVSQGGSDAISNIQPMCHQCNAKKRASSREDLRPEGWEKAVADAMDGWEGVW